MAFLVFHRARYLPILRLPSAWRPSPWCEAIFLEAIDLLKMLIFHHYHEMSKITKRYPSLPQKKIVKLHAVRVFIHQTHLDLQRVNVN